MIIWDNFKLRNSNATITLSAATYDVSGVTHDALSIDKPILSPTFAGVSTIQGDLVLNNQRIVPESVEEPGAGIHIQPSTISIWGSTISIDGSTVDFRSSSITNSGQAYFRQLKSTGSTIHSLTVTAAASIAQATITTLNVTNPVTLPTGSKIAGDDIIDWPCRFELYSIEESQHSFTIYNRSSKSLKYHIGSGNEVTILPHYTHEDSLGSSTTTATFYFTFFDAGYSGTEESTTITYDPNTMPTYNNDNLGYVVTSIRAKDEPSWLLKTLYYSDTTNIGAILYSIFGNWSTQPTIVGGQREMADFFHVHNYKVGIGNYYNGPSQNVTNWGVLTSDGTVDMEGYNNTDIASGGIILFKSIN